LQWF
jgi:hypothetical protein